MSKLFWTTVITIIAVILIAGWCLKPSIVEITPVAEQGINDVENYTPPPPPVPLEEKIGQLFIIGHWIGTPIASTTELITKHHLGGVIIMGHPDKASNTKDWVDIWQKASKTPLLITVDQEGGAVTRYKEKGFTQTSQREILDSKTAYKVGYTRGKELATLGINTNYSPVLDSAKDADSFMYKRVFKNRSDSATLATSMIEGMKNAGVIGVVKHFPGHDDTDVDSHLALPVVDIDRSELNNFVSPFIEIIKNNPPEVIMTAHVLFPKIDPLPATLSRFFLTDYLRTQLGFTGVIITDDMSMDAIDTNWHSSEASIKTITAGADIVLFAAEPELVTGAMEALKRAIENGTLSEDRISESYERIMFLKQGLPNTSQ